MIKDLCAVESAQKLILVPVRPMEVTIIDAQVQSINLEQQHICSRNNGSEFELEKHGELGIILGKTSARC